MPNLQDRFWLKVNKDGPTVRPELGPCWIWTGGRDLNKYGRFYIGSGRKDNRQMAAHRFAWELSYGPIPGGLRACHRCDNPPCVRPDHLFLGTQADNMVDCRNKGRLNTNIAPAIAFVRARSAGRTHCRLGHALTKENRRPNGRCRACAIAQNRSYRARIAATAHYEPSRRGW